MRTLIISVSLCLLATICNATDYAPVLDGVPLTQRFVGNPPNEDKLVEFIRQDDSFQKWDRLMAFRLQHLPQLHNDPKEAANAKIQFILSRNPEAKYMMYENKSTGEVVADFFTWPASPTFVELNIFKFSKNLDGQSILSVQFAKRYYEVTADTVNEIKDLRKTWVEEAVKFPMQEIIHGLPQ
jgi:hypothetical protein